MRNFELYLKYPQSVFSFVVCSIHFEARRDMNCYIWPLVVFGIGENCAECCLLLLQLCLFTQQEECHCRG